MPNNVLGLTREQLAKFLPDPQSIRAFEKLVIDATTTTPENVEAVTNIANSALAMAAAAISQLSELVEALDAALSAPADTPLDEQEDFIPNYSGSFGTLAYQNDDEVEIIGGSITGVAISGGSGSFTNITYSEQLTSTIATGTAPMVIASTTKVANLNVDLLDGADWASPAGIGTTAPSTGAFTSLSYSGQLTSTVATGTAPMVVSSTTKVSNLNVDLLDGGDWAAPGTIGATTPNSGVFTALSTNGTANANLGTDTTNTGVNVRGSNSGVAGGTSLVTRNNGTAILAVGNKSAINGGAYDATPFIFGNATIEFNQQIRVPGGAFLLNTSAALTNGAGAAVGTITNAPAAGNPTKWIAINDNGVTRYIPAW